MSKFNPGSYQILIVEDCPIWRRNLEAMYSRCLFGKVLPCQNIFLAATAEDAVIIMQKMPQQFNLISLDINLGSRKKLGLENGKSGIAVTGLDVLDQMNKLQRGAAVVVITGASSDSELPSAFTAEDENEGLARAKTTLATELQELFQDAFRFFPKEAAAEQSNEKKKDAEIQRQISEIEKKLKQSTLFSISEKRVAQLIKAEIPSLCVMIVLDDSYFEGHDQPGSLFAAPEHRFIRFDFFVECIPQLQKVSIWGSWPDPGEYIDKDSLMDAQQRFYYGDGKSPSAAQIALDRAIKMSENNIVLRHKPTSLNRCAAPKNTTTIPYDGSPRLTDVHKEFLLRLARYKIINQPGGPLVGDSNDKKTASELRSRLRQAYRLRNDEQNPVISRNPDTNAVLVHYDINMEVFLCSKHYINPPPKPKTMRRRKIVMPNVINFEEKKAIEDILNSQLIHRSKTEYSNSVEIGHIVRTEPGGGEKISIGSEVVLVVSKGPEKVVVPKVKDFLEEEATRQLQDVGLTYRVELEFSDTVKEGEVVRSKPGGGEKITIGSTVVLVVSKGPEKVVVPEVKDFLEEEATRQLRDVGLTYRVELEFSDTVKEGEVVRTEPGGGEKISIGSTVVLVVSKGPEKVVVPEVKDLLEEEATRRLLDLGLACKVEPEFNDTVKEGEVIRTEPGGGETISIGSEVVLVVSIGQAIM